MSFAGARYLGQPGGMAKIEIMKRTANPYRNLIWRWRLTTSIIVNWPDGWDLQVDAWHGTTTVESSDPNNFYRAWLEKNAGRQGWDWEWRIKEIDITASHERILNIIDMLEVRFRDENVATMFALKYS